MLKPLFKEYDFIQQLEWDKKIPDYKYDKRLYDGTEGQET